MSFHCKLTSMLWLKVFVGYGFVIFDDELSARELLKACFPDTVGRMTIYIAIEGGRLQKTVRSDVTTISLRSASFWLMHFVILLFRWN